MLILFRNLINYSLIHRFLYSLSNGDKTISYNACEAQLLFVILFGATELFSVLWPLCGHLNLYIMQPLWAVESVEDLVFAVGYRLSGHISTTLPGLKSNSVTIMSLIILSTFQSKDLIQTLLSWNRRHYGSHNTTFRRAWNTLFKNSSPSPQTSFRIHKRRRPFHSFFSQYIIFKYPYSL